MCLPGGFEIYKPDPVSTTLIDDFREKASHYKQPQAASNVGAGIAVKYVLIIKTFSLVSDGINQLFPVHGHIQRHDPVLVSRIVSPLGEDVFIIPSFRSSGFFLHGNAEIAMLDCIEHDLAESYLEHHDIRTYCPGIIHCLIYDIWQLLRIIAEHKSFRLKLYTGDIRFSGCLQKMLVGGDPFDRAQKILQTQRFFQIILCPVAYAFHGQSVIMACSHTDDQCMGICLSEFPQWLEPIV